MKVAIVINTAWNIYNFRRGIVRALIEQGHEVLAIAPYDEYVDKLRELGCTFVPLPMEVSGINPISDFRLFLRFIRITQKHKPDVLLTFTIKPNIYGSMVARLLKVPIVCNLSGLGTVFIDKNIVSKVAIGLYRISVKYASHVFFQNDEDQELFLSKVSILGSNSLLNGSGVDLDYFQPVYVQNNPITFLMIARPMIEKGIYEYVEATRIVKQKYPEVTFQLIGRWDKSDKRSATEEEMEVWQKEGLISYLGVTDDIRSAIAIVDALVLPSYREGTPRTLLEGSAMGKPSITTNVPGCHHVVKDGFNGFLCEVKSAQSLAEALLKYVESSSETKDLLAKNSRKYVEEKYGEKMVIEAYNRTLYKLGLP